MNSFFCGATYSEATASCSAATACPTGVCADDSKNCYSGIQCAATEVEPPMMATMAEPAPVDPVTPMVTTMAKPAPVEKYCGATGADAQNRCATSVPCPDGLSDVCPSGEFCFPVPQGCDNVDGGNNGGTGTSAGMTDPPVGADTNASSNASAPSIPDEPSYIHYTAFCGVDYNDASNNCFVNTPCPSTYSTDCPDGQFCFPVGLCQKSNTISSNIGDVPTSELVSSPGLRPTPPPTWNFNYVIMRENGAVGSCTSMVAKSVALGGIVLAALLL